ncbi:LCP family glycopolymer transferase [Gordonia sp. NPDC003950]
MGRHNPPRQAPPQQPGRDRFPAPGPQGHRPPRLPADQSGQFPIPEHARPRHEAPAFAEPPTVRVADPREAAPPPRAYSQSAYAPTQKPEPVPDRERRPVPPNRQPSEQRPRGADQPPRPPAARRAAGSEPPRRRRMSAFRRSPGRPGRRFTRRRVGTIFLVALLVALVTPIALMFYYDSKLHRVDALAPYAGRPADTPGTTWLIVGTDSRADLTEEQRRELATGDSDGARTDTIMMVYKPPSGDASIISIPRDLYVPVPGQGQHKINAAFNFGGPQLLVQTVEQLSGVRIDHYAEIGFGGFDQLVDAVGGVDICIDTALRDPKAGLNLQAGCQTLGGAQALGFVRTRNFPNADLERVQNQRKFLAALMSKATSPSVIANPFRLFPFVNGVVDTLTVDNGTHIWNLAMLAWWLRSSPQTVTTPNGGAVDTDDGSSLAVDDSTTEFFDAIRMGRQIPQQ